MEFWFYVFVAFVIWKVFTWAIAFVRWFASIGDGPQEVGRGKSQKPKLSELARANSRPIRDKWEYQITYCDRDGVVTTRKIANLTTDNDVDPLIRAFCQLRDEPRSFRNSSIIECIDLETGEIINDLGRRVHRKSKARKR